MAQRKLKIEQRPIDSLVPYARNARTHSDEQVAQIAASIKEFGWTNPVLVDGKNGIVAGHGRVLAARSLGETKVPCLELSGLSESETRAYILADNKLAENAGWDDELLRLELGDLSGLGADLALLGFSEAELIDILEAENAVDPAGEWEGMPEFSQGDKTAFRTIPIHFKDQDEVDNFARLIGQKITDKARFIWFPEIEIETYADKVYEKIA